jgi:hypothetical protein
MLAGSRSRNEIDTARPKVDCAAARAPAQTTCAAFLGAALDVLDALEPPQPAATPQQSIVTTAAGTRPARRALSALPAVVRLARRPGTLRHLARARGRLAGQRSIIRTARARTTRSTRCSVGRRHLLACAQRTQL